MLGVGRFQGPYIGGEVIWRCGGEILGFICEGSGRFRGSCLGGWKMGEFSEPIYRVGEIHRPMGKQGVDREVIGR